MAIIHGLANVGLSFVRDAEINLYYVQTDITLAPSSPLCKFFDECRSKPPLERSKLLENTAVFADIHASVASVGQSALPLTNDHVDQGYTCFVSAPGEGSTGRRVIELDGGRAGPVDRGECTDLLEDVARIARDDFIKNSKSVKFSLMYLGQPSM